MRYLKTIAHYVILLVGLSLVTLVAAEVALRLSGHVSVASVHTVSAAEYDRIPGPFEPNQRLIETPHPRLHYRVTINALGYRGPDIERVKPSGTVRILCIGDSGTYGEFVDDSDTLSALLQQQLRHDGFEVEVINGGVPGTTIVDQMQFLRRGMALDPDLVILTFSENDITDLGAAMPQYLALEQNRILKSRPGFKLVYQLARDTALFNYMLRVKAKWMAYVRTRPQMTEVSPDPEVERTIYESWWVRYAAELKDMQRFLAERQVRFLFNAYPTHQRIGVPTPMDSRQETQLQRVQDLARSLGIPTIETLPFFVRSGHTKEDLYHLPYDGHANGKGYRIQTGALLSAVRDNVVAVMHEAETRRHAAVELAGSPPVVRRIE
jgi:lysophospholipase L1-like esterase